MTEVVHEVLDEVVTAAVEAVEKNDDQVEEKQETESVGNQPDEAEAAVATSDGNEQAMGERTSVFFGNLPWSTSWQDLKDHIKEAGFEPGYVDVIRDKKTRLSKGFGLANFSNSKDAMACIAKLNNSDIDGRSIYVKLDRPPPAKRKPGGGVTRKSQGSKLESGGRIEGEQLKAPKATSDRVFVGNLAWSVTWSALVNHMKKAGEVVYAEILTGVRDRSMGCALVAYKTKDQAQEALNMLSDTEIDGRKIYVREDRESYWTVFVNNIPQDMTWQKLKDLCNEYGKVARSDRNSKGYGTVRFESEDDAKACIEGLNGKEYEGCTLQAMFAHEAGEYQRAAEEGTHDEAVEETMGAEVEDAEVVDEEANEEEAFDNKEVMDE